MARLTYTDLVRKPMDVLDMTSLTPDEFQQLVPAFETAFQAHMAEWCLDGTRRTSRRFAVYKNCPLPTAEDRLLFILVYEKTYPLQTMLGLQLGLSQGREAGRVAFEALAPNALDFSDRGWRCNHRLPA